MSADIGCDPEPLMKEAIAAHSPALASVLCNPSCRIPFSLPSTIAEFIRVRDNIWARVKTQIDGHLPTSSTDPARLRGPAGVDGAELNIPVLIRDLGLLETANKASRLMVDLKPGPTTPVLHPLRAACERLLCDCCEVFINRIRTEIPSTRIAVPLNSACSLL